MADLTLLSVFCEGAHDVAYCRSVFKHFFRITKADWKFSDFPSPLNSLLSKSMAEHALKDLSLDMSHKFFLPDWALYDGDRNCLVLLFNGGGKTKTANPKAFLTNFLSLLPEARTFPNGAEHFISDSKYLFIYDADHSGVDEAINHCRESFATIDDAGFISGDFQRAEHNELAATLDDKAVYIWCNKAEQKGSLEDILLPLSEVHSGDLIQKSSEFVDSIQTPRESTSPEIIYANRSKRFKAILGAAGQGKKPGRPLSAIINDEILYGADTLINDEMTKAFAQFVSEFSGWELHNHE